MVRNIARGAAVAAETRTEKWAEVSAGDMFTGVGVRGRKVDGEDGGRRRLCTGDDAAYSIPFGRRTWGRFRGRRRRTDRERGLRRIF